jgi:hypothetical protein
MRGLVGVGKGSGYNNNKSHHITEKSVVMCSRGSRHSSLLTRSSLGVQKTRNHVEPVNNVHVAHDEKRIDTCQYPAWAWPWSG